jgi:hypothetical protein
LVLELDDPVDGAAFVEGFLDGETPRTATRALARGADFAADLDEEVIAVEGSKTRSDVIDAVALGDGGEVDLGFGIGLSEEAILGGAAAARADAVATDVAPQRFDFPIGRPVVDASAAAEAPQRDEGPTVQSKAPPLILLTSTA